MTDFAIALNNMIDTVKSVQSLEGTLAEFASSRGFDCYAFLQIGSPEVDAVSNYPVAWQRRYLQNSFFEDDPVVKKARRVMRPFMWLERIKSVARPKLRMIFSTPPLNSEFARDSRYRFLLEALG